jgi:hypothetical protein|tara:strand:+ start:3686 stop:4735 length:1050 start_codon:yes stop_codon:yes gene_type:complete
MSPEKIYDTLISLGYRLDDRGAYWQTNALFRNGNSRTAVQIYKDSGVWRDYVTNTPYLKLEVLIAKTLGTEDPKVLAQYLKQADIEGLGIAHNKVEKIEMEKIYERKTLDKLLPHYDFYLKKGISRAVLENLRGGLATAGQLYQRFVFPIYNKNLDIHGFSGRDMMDKDSRPKWKHLGRKSAWLYPLYLPAPEGGLIRQHVEEADSIMLVESIGDLLSCHQEDIYNAVVSFGLDISPTLICEMVEINPSRIIISFNNDADKELNRGLEAAIKNYLKLLNHFDPHKLEICLPVKNDFGDMGPSDFAEWRLKLSKPVKASHPEKIIQLATKLYKDKKISKNLFKNTRLLDL